MHWKYIYENAPGLRKQTFIDGAKIIKDFLRNSKTKEEKQIQFKQLIELFDRRKSCWGEAAKINGKKALAFIEFYPEENDTIYHYLKLCIDEGGNSSSPAYFFHYYQQSRIQHKKSSITRDGVRNVYQKIEQIAEHNIQQNQKSAPEHRRILHLINSKHEPFQGCGGPAINDCGDVIRTYGPNYHAKMNDSVEIRKYYRTLLKHRCTEKAEFLDVAINYNKYDPSPGKCRFISKAKMQNSIWNEAAQFRRMAI